NRIGVLGSTQHLLNLDGLSISNNTFSDNAVAGILLDAGGTVDQTLVTVAGNTFTSNGKRSGNTVDSAGHRVNDGLHVTVPLGSRVEIRDNVTRDNANYGIEAVPGSVVDGGGNRSTGDPAGCLGVRC